ncbi:hypothetical protein CEAn_00229 [Coxiella endosymbiont of Amblyomma nuttalli]|nr:hypothetical protein CEAn_00229 [Coxiella endosymbiont of Amblyomma nuttalli]
MSFLKKIKIVNRNTRGRNLKNMILNIVGTNNQFAEE